MMQLVVCTDQHYGLQTELMDMTKDINRIVQEIIDYTLKLDNPIFISCGDWYHNNKPSTYLEKLTIKALNRLEEAEIPTIIIIGNHETIAEPGRKHALEPLQEINYRNIRIIDDVEVVQVEPFYNINFICLPHISKSRLVDKKETITKPDKYFEKCSKEILETLDDTKINIVLSHLNIEGAQAGSEGYFIKGEHENFPSILKNSSKIHGIINGHLHKRQILQKTPFPVILPGSIQRNNFGEATDEKSFMVIEI